MELPYRDLAPRMNSITEQWIESCQQELLDRTLIWSQRRLFMRCASSSSSTTSTGPTGR